MHYTLILISYRNSYLKKIIELMKLTDFFSILGFYKKSVNVPLTACMIVFKRNT